MRRGKQSGNRQFARDVTAWTFQESNVLRIDTVEHRRVNETLPRETYTINDRVVRAHHPSCNVFPRSQVFHDRRTPHTSRSSTRNWTCGSRTLTSRACSSSSPCSIRIFARRSLPFRASLESTRSRSVFRTGMASSNSSLIINAKGESLAPLCNCKKIDETN